MLTYRRFNDLVILGYSDFDFVGYPNDKKPTSRYVFMKAKGLVLWKSVNRSLITTFTMEAGACYEDTLEIILLKNFISRFNLVESILKPLTIYYDNTIIITSLIIIKILPTQSTLT